MKIELRRSLNIKKKPKSKGKIHKIKKQKKLKIMIKN